MFFRITYNRGQERFVKTKSNAEADEVEKRLQHVKQIGKIQKFERLDFEKITPEDVSKDEKFTEKE